MSLFSNLAPAFYAANKISIPYVYEHLIKSLLTISFK